jgi:quercetin dioxygenase-like cupin family protein
MRKHADRPWFALPERYLGAREPIREDAMNQRVAAALAAGVVVGGGVSALAEDQIAPAQRQTLLQTTEAWNGQAYTKYPAGKPQLTILKVTIAAHTKLPWHTHPIPNAGYIVSGELTVEDKETGKKRTFRAGDAFGESVDDVHRGMAGDQPVTVLAFYAGTAETPVSVPLKAGEKEY